MNLLAKQSSQIVYQRIQNYERFQQKDQIQKSHRKEKSSQNRFIQSFNNKASQSNSLKQKTDKEQQNYQFLQKTTLNSIKFQNDQSATISNNNMFNTQNNLNIKKQKHQKSTIQEVLHFMKGNFKRKLSNKQQEQIYRIFKNSKKQKSIFIYNSSELKRIFKNWKQKLQWITPYYAVKTNDSKLILQELINLGSNFDCASKNQIINILSLGAKPSQIIYSNCVKDQDDLRWAVSQNIQLTTADSINELIKIKNVALQMRVLWRIAIKDDADTVKTFFSQKFGDQFQNQQEIHQRMKEIQKIGVSLKGIHFHCGSKNTGTSSFGIAILLARKCMEIGKFYGHEMSILDIGGGFPGQQLPESIIQDLKPTQKDPLNYKVIAQPGCHFSSNCFYILVKIIGKKLKKTSLSYYINDSIYHSLNNFFTDGINCDNDESQFYSKIDWRERISIKSSNQSFQKSKIFGMTCCGLDIIMKNLITPTNLNSGDWICMGGMGAYTLSLKSTFNGMQSTNEILVWSPEQWSLQYNPIYKQTNQN